MVFDDLRSFVKKLEEDGDLDVVEGVDWDLEIGTISELIAEKDGHTLLFDRIKGYPQGYRVVTNLFNTKERFATAIDFPQDIDKLEFVKRWRGMKLAPHKPAQAITGPVI